VAPLLDKNARIYTTFVPSGSPPQLQHEFYTATAHTYDEKYVRSHDEHFIALSVISALIEGYRYESVLDVGAGTGRGVKYLRDHHPHIEIRGLEPVRAMIEQAEKRNGVPAGCIVEGLGAALPFPDLSFDAVCELGVLHHVSDPGAVVQEMARVARRAVVLSDSNRFANGGPLHRAVKYMLFRLKLWPIVYRLATRGRGYHLSLGDEGDGGVVYSYSVYDSLNFLNEWADRVFLVPLVPARASWFHPLFSATNVLLCAIRDRTSLVPSAESRL
jgi:ubiquinone/menaquinone biosynthesis C-methylase UbiE